MDYIGPVTTVALFLVVAIGSLIIWELRKIHARIDKYSGKMDKHIEEGVKVHTGITEIKTTLNLHMNNGHRHE